MEEVIKQFAEACKGKTTNKEVKKYIFETLWENYKGRAPKAKVETVADDITESVCLKLKINN